MQNRHPYLKDLITFTKIRYRNFNNDPMVDNHAKVRSLTGAALGAAFSFANNYTPFWGSVAVVGGAVLGFTIGECYDGQQDTQNAFNYIRNNPNVDKRLHYLLGKFDKTEFNKSFTSEEIQQIANQIINKKIYSNQTYATMKSFLPDEVLEKVNKHINDSKLLHPNRP